MNRSASLLACALMFVALPVGAAVVECVAVIVDNRVICLSEVEEQEAFLQRLGALSGKDLRQEAMDALIDKALVEREAERLGLRVSDEEVTAAADDIRSRNGLDPEAFKAALAAQGLEYDKYLEQIRSQLLRTKLAGQVLRPKLQVGDAALREFYLKNVADYREPERVHLQHIQLSASQGLGAADAVRRRILAGEEFSVLAREVSSGPAAKRGGDMGLVPVENLTAEVRSAVTDLEAGGISPVVDMGETGLHLFRVVERHKGRIPPFEEVLDRVRSRYFDDREQELYQSWIQSLREKAQIDRKL